MKEKYNERTVWIITLICIEPTISRQNIANIIGKSLSTIEKDINILRKAKIINRKGADKTGEWIIIPNLNNS